MNDKKITYSDIQLIIGMAKQNYVDTALPMKVSKKDVINNDPAHVVMIDTVLNFLNSKGLISPEVRIDYDEK